MATYPFLAPNPPRLSEMSEELRRIEASGQFCNYGPTNSQLEQAFLRGMFGGDGACLTVCNATIGLMTAIKHVTGRAFGGQEWRLPAQRKYALMPSFTFAATAHAALWNGLTPLLCDIDPDTWLPSAAAEDRLLERHGDEIAVIVPYATFGNGLDLDRYTRLAERWGIPVVVDAAASLGSQDGEGRGFGTGFAYPVVFSMHVTKTFATGEAGLVYCADAETIQSLRHMGNFGFSSPRSAAMPGLNSKLTEIGALLGLAKLGEFADVVDRRMRMAALYRRELPDFEFQKMVGARHAYQFVPTLLPVSIAAGRANLMAALADRGVGVGSYFSPHLAEQPYFRDAAASGPLPVTEAVASRALSLPLHDRITEADVMAICAILREVVAEASGAC